MFKRWSELNDEAKSILKPDFGLRSWNELSKDEKYRVWKHLEEHFFDLTVKNDYNYNYSEFVDEDRLYYSFYGYNHKQKRIRVDVAIYSMYSNYKARNYAQNFLKKPTHFSACLDFYHIFSNEDANVVFEMLSFYCLAMMKERDNNFSEVQNNNSTEEEIKKEKIRWRFIDFDEFAKDLNEVFDSFGVDVHLSRNGFMPRQEEQLIKSVYEPVLKSLADDKWKEVNTLLTDAFLEYRRNTPNGYSTCVTHTVSAMQAFLQILVNGKTGIGDISKLIVQAQRENLIPNDMFTKEIFKNIESIMMRERQETGDAHPKKDYASEKNAKLVLNLAMVFLQHCLVM